MNLNKPVGILTVHVLLDVYNDSEPNKNVCSKKVDSTVLVSAPQLVVWRSVSTPQSRAAIISLCMSVFADYDCAKLFQSW